MKYLNLIFVFLVLVGCSNKGEKQANALLSKSFFLEKSINEIILPMYKTHFQNTKIILNWLKNVLVPLKMSLLGE